MKKRIVIIIGIAVLLKIGIILFTYHNYGSNIYVWHYARDFDVWFDAFGKIDEGLIPLVDFPKEYPSGAVVLYWALSHLYSEPRQFILLYGIFMFLVDMAVAVVLWKICRIEKNGNASAIVLAYLFLPTVLILNHVRFDIVPVFLMILAYYYWRKGKFVGPAILLGLAISLKWFSVFAVIAIFLNEIATGQRLRRAIGRAAISITAFAVVDMPFLLLNYFRGTDFTHWTASYSEQYGRTVCVDTLAGMAQMLFDVTVSSKLIFGITLISFLLIVLLHNKKNVSSNYVLYCFSFLLFNKIYSPQFHIWFLPFLLLCLPAEGYWRFWNKGPEIGIPAIFIFEIVNMLVYPFSFTWFLQDVRSFTYADVLSVKIFCCSIVLRALFLLWLGWGLWKKH